MQPNAINLAEMRARHDGESDEESPPPIVAYTLNTFLDLKIPAKTMLLAPWLPEAGIAMVFAPRGIGKTYLALGVAYAVATGGTFLRWRAPSPRRVLVIDGEMPAATQQERWSKMIKASDREPPGDDYVRILASDLCELGLPDLSTEDGQREINAHIGDADLIIVDNLSTLARSGKENESESWGSLQDWALRQRRQGRSVLFIHHAGKGGEQRGTSKREDIMDSVIKLSLPSDYNPADGARFNISFTKSRGFFGEDAEPFEAALRDGVWSTKSLEDVIAAQVQALSAEGLNQRDIAKEVGRSPATVNRILKRFKEGS